MKQLEFDFDSINLSDYYVNHKVIDEGKNPVFKWSDSLSDDGKKKPCALIGRWIAKKTHLETTFLSADGKKTLWLSWFVASTGATDGTANDVRLVRPSHSPIKEHLNIGYAAHRSTVCRLPVALASLAFYLSPAAVSQQFPDARLAT